MSGNIFMDSVDLSVVETVGDALIAVRRSGDLSLPVTVEYGSSGIDATAGSDFVLASGFVTMAAGVDRAFIPVTVINDTDFENSESFSVNLINVSSGTLQAPRTTRVTILDDENPITPPIIPPLVSDYNVTETVVVGGLTQPIDIEFAPPGVAAPAGSQYAYVAEKGGRILVVDTASGQTISVFVDISDQVNNVSDRGMTDIALHPNFPAEPYIYAFYVVDPPDTAGRTDNGRPDGIGNRFAYLSRFEADPATNYQTAIPGSETVLVGGAGQFLTDLGGNGLIDSTSDLSVPESGYDPVTDTFVDDFIKVDSLSHAGGGLAFGPDGALYVSIGDGTSYNVADPRTVSVQDLRSLSGTIIRIDPETGLGLPDNPFVPDSGDLSTNQARIYQYGLRNPFSISFDDSGRLFTTDTGWFSYEEINTGPAGANFGWPYFEGGDFDALRRTPNYENFTEAFTFYQQVNSGDIVVTAPYRGFSHANEAPGFQVQAITGGNVDYSGGRYPSIFDNDYFFSDVAQGEVYTIDLNNRLEVTYLYTTPTGFGPVHFTQGPDGYVYYADLVRNHIGRLDITGDEPPPLSELIVNGGFEAHPALAFGGWDVFTAIEGWTATTGLIEVQELSGPSGNVAGDAVVELDAFANSTITQTVLIPDAGLYRFAFDYALGGTDVATNGIAVSVNGIALSVPQPTAPGYRSFTTDLSLPAGPVAVTFSALGISDGRGTHINNVSLQAVDGTPPANQPPVAVDDAYGLTAGQTLTVAAATGVRANDRDGDDPLSSLTVALSSGVGNGTLALSGDGSFVYTPNAGFSGADSFTYTLFDGEATSAPATVRLTVDPATPPPTGANLLVNGDFQDFPTLTLGGWDVFGAIPGWTASRGQIEVQSISGPSGNAAGDAVVELDALENSTVQQTVTGLAAGAYRLSFDYALGGTDPTTNGIAVTVNGVDVAVPQPTAPGYQTFTADLDLAAGDVTVAFAALGTSDGRGTHINNVALVAIDPGTPGPGPGPTPGTELVVNGGFENHPFLTRGGWDIFSSIEGWRALVGGVEVQDPGPGRGSAIVELDADFNSSIAQTITIPEDGTYVLSFDYAARDGDGATNGVRVEIGGQVFTINSPTNTDYFEFSEQITLSAGSTDLVLTGLGVSDALGTYIDDVSLIQLAAEASAFLAASLEDVA